MVIVKTFGINWVQLNCDSDEPCYWQEIKNEWRESRPTASIWINIWECHIPFANKFAHCAKDTFYYMPIFFITCSILCWSLEHLFNIHSLNTHTICNNIIQYLNIEEPSVQLLPQFQRDSRNFQRFLYRHLIAMRHRPLISVYHPRNFLLASLSTTPSPLSCT